MDVAPHLAAIAAIGTSLIDQPEAEDEVLRELEVGDPSDLSGS